MVGVRGKPDARWDWNFYLHLPCIFFPPNVGRCSIHGANGKRDRDNDVPAEWNKCMIHIVTYCSGQIIATSHDLTPNGGLVREITLFQGNSGW